MKKIKKRSGKEQDFDFAKIERGIRSAYTSVDMGNDASIPEVIEDVKKNIESLDKETYTYDNIQEMVEDVLINKAPSKVSKSYIRFRDKHKEIKSFVDKNIDFIYKYAVSDNTANSGTPDDNSNVGTKNIGVLNAEIHKPENILISRKMIKRKLKELYPDFDAEQYERDIENHIIYKHDESSFAGPIAPYTYSSKEVVNVKYNEQRLLIPFDALWDMVAEESVCVDETNNVYQKYPKNLYVLDDNGNWTVITHLTKKQRHRDLVRVKTKTGEDLVVTDNHPMIIDKTNVDNTVEAIKSLGEKQYRVNNALKFDRIAGIDMSRCYLTSEFNDQYCFNQNEQTNNLCHRFVKTEYGLGYVIGLFIGGGNIIGNTVYFVQSDRKVLLSLIGVIHSVLGVSGKIFARGTGYSLEVESGFLVWLLKDYFKISDKPQNKIVPFNVYDFVEEFARGIIFGLVDSVGEVNGSHVCIGLQSRGAILQCTELLRQFGVRTNNTVKLGNPTIWYLSFHMKESLQHGFNKLILTGGRTVEETPDFSGETEIIGVQSLSNSDSFVKDNEYIYDITTDTHTFALNNILVHNCCSISMYPFLTHGIKNLGGLSAAPKNLDSYCGMLVNLIFAVSSNFAGACAVPESLLYFTHFCKKEWGEDFWKRPEEIITASGAKRVKTIRSQIHQFFQQIVYSINQVSSGRNCQSPFTNFSYYDEAFFHGMFDGFAFPDGTKPDWESLNWIQREFMQWFNEERTKCMMTFPVESYAMVYKDGKFVDEESAKFVAQEYARGHSFFTYISDTVDSLSSCCRLKNKLQTKEFNFTNGNMGLETGSKSVISLNLSRIIQSWARKTYSSLDTGKPMKEGFSIDYDSLKKYLINILERVYKYHTAYNEYLWEMYNAGLLPVYSAGFLSLNKQYLTIGLSGLNQAAEYLGLKCNDNESYKRFCQEIFGCVKEQNTEHKTKKLVFNTEQVPAESLAIKNYDWDKADGYWTPSDTNLYASYVFKPNDSDVNMLEKIRLHGKEYIGDFLDGGSAAHLNIAHHLSEEQYWKLLNYAAQEGCQYLTWNCINSVCTECGHIEKEPFDTCPNCGSNKVDHYDRVIGYLTKIKNWSKGRQEEQKLRVYNEKTDL